MLMIHFAISGGSTAFTMSNREPHPAPPTVDTSRASIARVYDVGLGGKDNFEADRVVVDSILEIDPDACDMARAIRRWLIRAISYLSGNVGLDQFLDLGAGLPTVENTHDTAQRFSRDAVVVYVDNDPAVNAYGQAILTDNAHTFFANADLLQPAEVLSAREMANLDFERPLALIQCATLHHVDDEDDPWTAMREYIDALPSGSYVALLHWWNPADGGEGERHALELERRWRESSMGTGRYRTRAEIERFFDGLEILEPGVVEMDEWWPAGPQVGQPTLTQRLVLAGIGRKP